jgi:hypothetical protein
VIGEAFDTAVTLGWALLVWVLLLGVFGSLAVYAAVVGVWCACRAVARGVAAVSAAMRARSALSASLAASSPSEAPDLLPHPPDASQAHTGRRAPSWANTQPIKEN